MNAEEYYEELYYNRALNEFIDTLSIQIREYEQSLSESGIPDPDVIDMLDDIQHVIEDAKYLKLKSLKELKDRFNNVEEREIGFKANEIDYDEITPDTVEKDLHANKYNSVAKINVDGKEVYKKLTDIKIVDFDDNFDKVDNG